MSTPFDASGAGVGARAESSVSAAAEPESVEEPDEPGERSHSGVVCAMFAAYLLLASGLSSFRGFRFISPGRWAAAWSRVSERARTWELGGIAAVTAVAVFVDVFLLDRGSIVGIDSAVEFWPTYGLMGELLRAGELPLWNRHLFAGSPLLADPQSGWMYFPAKALFTALPLASAVALLLALHLLMMGTGTYLLARVLRLSVPAAAVAAMAYQLSGHAVQRSSCCPAETEVLAWFPFALAGVALAARITDRWPRAAAWGLAGFSLAQILAAWTGQGAYYVTIAVAGFIAYLALFDPAAADRRWHERPREMLTHGIAVGALAAGLTAAALLPRVEYYRVSNLADGYPWDGIRGGWSSLASVAGHVIGRSSYAAGAALLTLALIGAVTGRRRHAAPAFVLLALLAATLSWRARTPLHDLLDAALPGFERMRQNRPERGLIVFFLPVAILAGIAIDCLPPLLARSRRALLALAPAGLMTLLVVWLEPRSDLVGQQAVLAIILVDLILVATVLLPLPTLRQVAPWLLTAVLLLDLFAADRAVLERDRLALRTGRVDLATFYDPQPAASFLMSVPGDEPFRFAGYDPAQAVLRDDVLYRHGFLSGATAQIIANNRAALVGLEDVEGSALPIHVALYDDLITVANGRAQGYHDGNLFTAGALSPILDLLNVRYLIVPAEVPPGRPDLLHLNQRMPTVFQNRSVRVLENVDALPRAWIVHEARSVGEGEALPLLASGAVDPRQVALFEGEAPVLAPAAGAGSAAASVVATSAGGMTIRTTSSAAGLLVVSEIAYPAWRAYVDGEPVPLYTADHALRAVPVPAGEHTVELRYESAALRAGLAISGVSYAALLAILAAAFVFTIRRRAPKHTKP